MKTEAEEGPAGSQVEKASDCTLAVDGGGKDQGTRTGTMATKNSNTCTTKW